MKLIFKKMLLKQHFIENSSTSFINIHLIYNHFLCCNHTCYCVGMVYATSVSCYVTAALRYQSRSLDVHQMSDSTELAEAVQIRDSQCYVALPHGALGWSTVCGCGITGLFGKQTCEPQRDKTFLWVSGKERFKPDSPATEAVIYNFGLMGLETRCFLYQ